ncbi:hypothetical protein THIOM_005278 [Candidatus Thiomargarita nelsonii]|uniref:Uncharacterized protein n=1 Tax=Candidatus Thiomargarita nelsonii TaxID=1003181 RepID=A0A176RTM5_9GAMM|nr:hypothetical protein THIOM_005278 [Candidatus Thiomargarita nelsonii]
MSNSLLLLSNGIIRCPTLVVLTTATKKTFFSATWSSIQSAPLAYYSWHLSDYHHAKSAVKVVFPLPLYIKDIESNSVPRTFLMSLYFIFFYILVHCDEKRNPNFKTTIRNAQVN